MLNMRTIYKYDIAPEFPSDLLKMSAKLRYLITPSGMVATRNQPNNLRWFSGLDAEPQSDGGYLLNKRGQVVSFLKKREGSGFVHYDAPSKQEAKVINVFGLTNPQTGVFSVNVAIEIEELKQGDLIGYAFRTHKTTVNGQPWLEATRNKDFKTPNTNWMLTNADNGELRDSSKYLLPQKANGHNVHEFILSRSPEFKGVHAVFSQEDAEDSDREQLVVFFGHGADSEGKGIFDYLAIDLQTYCPKLF